MEKVTGIGGFFFRRKDSASLDAWYEGPWHEGHLGIRKAGKLYEYGLWWQDEWPTVFASENDDAQVAGPGHSRRINFRVRNQDAMVAQLRAAGVSV